MLLYMITNLYSLRFSFLNIQGLAVLKTRNLKVLIRTVYYPNPNNGVLT